LFSGRELETAGGRILTDTPPLAIHDNIALPRGSVGIGRYLHLQLRASLPG